jgi:Mrp family chromosome partitioning ATPase
MADACLLVVRPGYTLRDMLEITLSEISTSGIKGVSLVINDIPSDSKRYGYGEKYGYIGANELQTKRGAKGRKKK